MGKTIISIDQHLRDLISIALGHRPGTVKGRLAVQNWCSAQLATNPAGSARTNNYMTGAVIDLLVKGDVAEDWRRFKSEGKAFKPSLPPIDAVPPLTPRQAAKKLRNEIYAERRAERAREKATKAAATQQKKDEVISALLAVEACSEEEAKPVRRFGFG